MKELQKKYLSMGVSPYSVPVTPVTIAQQNLTQTQLSSPHLNQIQMQNYLLGGLPLQNSSDIMAMYSSSPGVYNGNLDKSLPQFQISPAEITAGFSLNAGQSLSTPVASYPTVSPFLNNSSLSTYLISHLNSIPQQLQQNIQVHPSMPIIPSSSITKPQLHSLLPSSSPLDKARSSLLESFRSNQVPVLGLDDLSGHVLEFAQDQHGSRFIQQKLETASKEEKDKIFNEISPSALSLMTDVFGNYVIQKFVEFGSEEHQRKILMVVLPNVETLSVQMYGCRVIQKLLDTLSMEQKKIIFRKLEPRIEEYIKDHNGNHVIQKCIEVMDPEDKQIILNRYDNKYVELACHPYGCRIVQRLLEYCTKSQTLVLLGQLLVSTDHLLLDQYGNYVIQHVLDRGEPSNKSRIVSRIEGRVLMLSQHKFASNVVEKCVSNASIEERSRLICEVCQDDSFLGAMIKDQYGNYVVQKMIDTAGDSDLGVLMAKIKIHSNSLHKFSYGKYILAKLENYYKSDKWN